MARSFLNDPNLTEEEIIKNQKRFIEKYYNEIMVSAPKEIIKSDNLLRAIRKDLKLDDISDLERLFKGYSPNIEKINQEKSDDKNKN